MILNMTDGLFISSGALAGRNPVKLRQHDNRLWAVCDDGAIVFSDNGDADSWDALNVILLPNREPCIDFLPVQGGVILTARSSVYAMYGSGTYQDTSILPIQNSAAPGSKILLSDSAVVVDNVAYILGDRGVYQISLNGIAEVPHDQTAYFSANYPAWNAAVQSVQGTYLHRFHSILYLFQSGFDTPGLVFSIKTSAVSKVEEALPPALPYIESVPSAGTDFLLGSGDGTTICRSVYPAGVLRDTRLSVMQFRHEDADSMREKIWRHMAIVTEAATPNVLVQVYLDNSPSPTVIVDAAADLVEGDNIINLFDEDGNLLRSKSISIMLTVGGRDYLLDDDTGEVLLTTKGGEPLISDELSTMPALFAIREVRLYFREVGARR